MLGRLMSAAPDPSSSYGSTLERAGFSSGPKHSPQQKEKIGQENGTNVFNTLLTLFYDVTNLFLESYLNLLKFLSAPRLKWC